MIIEPERSAVRRLSLTVAVVLSFVGLGLVTFQPVYHPGFSNALSQPICDFVLQGDEKLRHQSLGFFGNGFSTRELYLEGELSHQGPMLAARPPQRNIAFGDLSLAEVQ